MNPETYLNAIATAFIGAMPMKPMNPEMYLNLVAACLKYPPPTLSGKWFLVHSFDGPHLRDASLKLGLLKTLGLITVQDLEEGLTARTWNIIKIRYQRIITGEKECRSHQPPSQSTSSTPSLPLLEATQTPQSKKENPPETT